MSILTYPLGFIGGGKEFYNGVIENSVRFDVASTSKLTRLTGSGGNEDCWTASLWVKRGNPALIDPLMTSSPATGTWTDSFGFIAFNAAVELLKETNQEHILTDAYKKCKAEENLPKEEMKNYIIKEVNSGIWDIRDD